MSCKYMLSMSLALHVSFTLYIVEHSEMIKYNISYSLNETLGNITAYSTLQCACRCSLLKECVAMDFLKDISMCVMLKSATKSNSSNELTNEQFWKLRCDDGWIRFERSCYHMTPSKHNWTTCDSICVEYGAHLATVTSKTESAFIANYRGKNPLWVGGWKKFSDDGDSVWQWANGEGWAYTNWYPTYPKSVRIADFCLAYYEDQDGWRDQQCKATKKCLCEKLYTRKI